MQIGSWAGFRAVPQPSNSEVEEVYFKGKMPITTLNGCPPSEGSASRFFKSIIYTAKASKKERNIGCGGLEEKRHADRNKTDGSGGENPRNRTNTPKKNFHPTVKPVELMEYLINMVTPKEGTVLDPFAGSGTTGLACKATNRKFIGIEKEIDYLRIAESRIKNFTPQLKMYNEGE